jgi:RimJ/RimL family protein N-acetyltransferase
MVEADRDRFVTLFSDPGFMVHFVGALSVERAHAFVDHLLEVNRQVPFAKQPVLERDSGAIVGYVGVDWIDLDGTRSFEFGYRLVPEARGRGYATEASRALLELAAAVGAATIYALIDPVNHPSLNTIAKLDFTMERLAVIEGLHRNVYRWTPPNPRSS